MSLKMLMNRFPSVIMKRNATMKIRFSSTNNFGRIGDLFTYSFNRYTSPQPPDAEPVDRSRELKFVLEHTLDNWNEMGRANKLTALFAPQSQGIGKTFLVQHLRNFMTKDMESGDSVVKKLMEDPTYAGLAKHLTALAATRSIVIPVDKLSVECASFEEAVVTEMVSQLSDKYPHVVLHDVRDLNIQFPQLYEELLVRNSALIVVLDDVMDLVESERPVHLAWLRSVALHTDTREQKTRAAITLLQDLLEPVLSKPGALLYMTGRAPDSAYQLLTTLKSSSLMAHAVLFDALQQRDIEQMLTLTPASKGSSVMWYEAIGLRDLEEVRHLAEWALRHTGGVPQVLTRAFTVLRSGEYLKPSRRTDGQSVLDVLSSTEVANEIYLKVKSSVPQSIVLNFSELSTLGGWDTDITTKFFIEVLGATGENATVPCSMQVWVTEEKHVAAVDLLSVLGVPFRRTSYDAMTVQLGAWSIRALLEAETVNWTRNEIVPLMAWMPESTKDTNEVLAESIVDAVNSTNVLV